MGNGEVQGWTTTDALRERDGTQRSEGACGIKTQGDRTVMVEKRNMGIWYGSSEGIDEGGVVQRVEG